MSVLHKYYLKEFIKIFLIVQMIITSIILSVDYITKLDIFIGSQATIFQTFEYVFLRAPIMLVGVIPSVIILCAVTAFGLMNRNNELVAIRSSGISVYYMIRPVIASGIFFSLLVFFLGETIVPVTKAKSIIIKHDVIEGHREIIKAKQDDIWLKRNNFIIHIAHYDPQDKTIGGVVVTELGNNFNITRRIDAQTGIYKNGKWLFSKIMEQRYSNIKKDYIVELYENKAYAINFVPEDIERVVKKSDEMSVFELAHYIHKVESEGYDATTYKVDFFGKTAFPFVCLLMAMIGAVVGMRPLVRENLPLGVAIGIGISFIYYIMHGLCMSLGYGKVLPAFISAWTPNLFFFCLSVLFLITIDD